MSLNQYGLNVDYNKRKLESILKDINCYTPDELSRELARLAVTADKSVLQEAEFNMLIPVTGNKLSDSKTLDLVQSSGYSITGFVLNKKDNHAIVDKGAVRHLTNEDLWNLMHPIA
ncbi:MAG: hypothetical protein HAW67_01510 [Endozoicomonadaceae bacterium]|nr:hypothetical protein [Endozoicomonadaceae bacterium]